MSDEQFNLGLVFETVAATIPEREAIVWGERRFSYAELRDRSRRLAMFLHQHGLGAQRGREGLAGHESAQDHLGLYLHNSNEYVEGMIGSYLARVAPFNVNYRYVEEELQYLLTDSGARAVDLPRHLRPGPGPGAPVAPEARAPPAGGRRVGQRPPARGRRLRSRPGVVIGPSCLRWSSRPTTSTSSTPGAPPACPRVCCGASTTSSGPPWAAGPTGPGSWWRATSTWRRGSCPPADIRVMSIPPLMHGAAQWACFYYMTMGATMVFPTNTRSVDPVDVWDTVARERVIGISVVGDAMARPVVEELERGGHDASTLHGLRQRGRHLERRASKSACWPCSPTS